jgi:hypothetical protein
MRRTGGEGVGPVGEGLVRIRVSARGHLHLTVGGHHQPVATDLGTDRRNQFGRGRGGDDDLTAGRDGEQALTLEPAGHHPRAVGHHVMVGRGRPRWTRVEPVPAARAPRLPTVLEDQGGGVVPEFCDGAETHGILTSAICRILLLCR